MAGSANPPQLWFARPLSVLHGSFFKAWDHLLHLAKRSLISFILGQFLRLNLFFRTLVFLKCPDWLILVFVFFLFFVGSFLFVWGTQARGQIGAAAAGLHHCQSNATARAMPDLSHIYDLYHSSWQRQILNPLSKARHRTCVLMDTSQVHYHGATKGTPFFLFFFFLGIAEF